MPVAWLIIARSVQIAVSNDVLDARRQSAFVTPVPKPRERRRGKDKKQSELVFKDEETAEISTAAEHYDTNTIINETRQYVDQRRTLPSPEQWQVW
jgi:type III restriction enzyme